MNNYFCVLPFFGYEFFPGGGSHCCLLPNNYNIDQIRQDILDKKRSEFCSKCWNIEDAGLTSDRIIKNETLDYFWDKDINLIEEEVRRGNFETLMVKNHTSNTCNLTCVTCGPSTSTAWGALEKKSKTIPINKIYSPATQTKDFIDKNLNFKKLISLNFLGGEPLYEKLNFYIMEKLIEHGNFNCFLQFTTNGSTPFNAHQKEIISKFKNINFNVSIDGTGPVLEYMRYPLTWDDLLNQLEFFRTITNNVSTSYTTSNLNVLYHHETTDWFKKQKLNFHSNPVTNPKHFRPGALPERVKKNIISKFGLTPDLAFYIGAEHTKQDDEDFEKMLIEIQRQDSIKQISIKNYLPEFCNLIGLL